ncbi:MAG: restriction endonuclease subunit S [Betaproteobacteria bacterium]|jgi:type I restriction enzyme S subunit|nr:restriction endonuclease subunit S [Betaproteobacteria bacterium]MBK9784380.1 restriction endonuclease subunit S [Candidatus Dechloromonas phosphorivorans]
MDAQQFLAEFGHIANAPGGVQQLREMVYQLAITGTLTSQLDTDGDARELLADISTLRDRLIREKAYKRLPKLEAEALDIPSAIELPATWCWTRLLDLGEISPRNDAPDEAAASFIPMSGFSEFHMGALAPEAEKWGRIKKGFTHFRNGDVVVAKITPCFENGKAAVIDGLEHSIGAGTTELHVFRPIHSGILPGYIYLFLRSPYFAIEGEKNMTGTAGQKRLPTEYFATRALPLPPSTEQSRIVAKVDELMALCDKLEAQQQARRKLQNKLRQSTLQAVASATSPHELQTTWARLADNFGRLFHAPEDVADLRKMASELAIRGALDVFSEPTDTSTVDVYLAELGRRKSGKRFAKSVQADEEIPLPNGWRWVLLEDLLSDSESGWSPKCEAEPRRDGEWGVLKVSAVTWGTFNPNENKRLPLSLEARPACEVKSGDFMLSRANTAELVARSVIAPDNCPEKLLMSDKIVRLNLLDNALKPWVNLVNNSDLARTYYKERATGTSDSMRNVSRQVIHELPIPLPSLKVQERVLLALSRLLRYCDSLEQQAASRMRLSAQLSASAVASLTGIAIEQEEEPMKAPQTELIAPLRLGAAPDIKAQAPLATILARHHGEMSAKDLWQRFGGEIDAFYAQLKTEVAHGWILEPAPAEMREKPADVVSA